ncbi:MAG: MBL fold metallo-hydrolase [Chloroflexota bacterium]
MFSFRALASGSSGNAFLLRTAQVALLFDAGLRMPSLARYLLLEGIAPEDLNAAFISHEHRDHCLSAGDLIAEHNVPIWANAEVLVTTRLHGLDSVHELSVGRPTQFCDVEVVTFPVHHDSVRPVGFLIRVEDMTIVIATDLGHAGREVHRAVAQADLLVIEANYDPNMLETGRYPRRLRRRVAGLNGHLSNQQAAQLICERAKNRSISVWLAHLSKENNAPALAVRTVNQAISRSKLSGLQVEVAKRDRPSLSWSGESAPRQLSLFGRAS